MNRNDASSSQLMDFTNSSQVESSAFSPHHTTQVYKRQARLKVTTPQQTIHQSSHRDPVDDGQDIPPFLKKCRDYQRSRNEVHRDTGMYCLKAVHEQQTKTRKQKR